MAGLNTLARQGAASLDEASRVATQLPISPFGDEARAAIARWNDEHPGQQAVTTIESGEWYPGEDYHQEYWEGEGQRNPYCQAVIPPKLMKLRRSFQKYLKQDA